MMIERVVNVTNKIVPYETNFNDYYFILGD